MSTALLAAVQAVTLFQAVTLAVAFLGAVLGIINTWHGLDKSKVKLKQPAHAIQYGGADPLIGLSIQITNLSAFAVTIEEVGMLYHGKTSRGGSRPGLLLDDSAINQS